MTSTKIRFDLPEGIIEAEGSEEFVKAVYGDFKHRLETSTINKTTKSQKSANKQGSKKPSPPVNRKKRVPQVIRSQN